MYYASHQKDYWLYSPSDMQLKAVSRYSSLAFAVNAHSLSVCFVIPFPCPLSIAFPVSVIEIVAFPCDLRVSIDVSKN
jgi:hypothetical protein